MRKSTKVVIFVSIIVFINVIFICSNIIGSNEPLSDPIYIDGSDATNILICARVFLYFAVYFGLFVYGLLAIGAIWAVYGIVLAIIHAIKHKKLSK